MKSESKSLVLYIIFLELNHIDILLAIDILD